MPEPKELMEARAALSQAEEILTNPGMLKCFERGISLLADLIASEDCHCKEIAKNLACAYQARLVSKIKHSLSDFESCSDDFLIHWGNVLNAFLEAGLDRETQLATLRIEILERLNARLHANSIPVDLDELQRSVRDYVAKKT